MTFKRLAVVLALSGALPVCAQPMSVSVKQIGATFLEAPPNREKALIPMGAFSAQERVETHAVLTFKNRIVADLPLWGNDSKVAVAAILGDRTVVELGSAEVGSFRKISEDRRRTLVTLGVGRLPDKPVSGVRFSGMVKVNVAKGEVHKVSKFDPKVGATLDAGLGTVTVKAIDATSITFAGGDQLGRVAAMKLIKADGSAVAGQRGAYGRQGGGDGIKVESQWTFSGPIGAGKIDVTVYDGLELIDVPVDLIVAKPY